jgi:hypothetical protein
MVGIVGIDHSINRNKNNILSNGLREFGSRTYVLIAPQVNNMSLHGGVIY